MAEQGGGGAIVNVGSMWAVDAITATPTSAYSAAQAGRHALTKNLAIELAPVGIRVNTVALAFVETPAYERFMSPEQAREVLDSVNAFHPLGRHGVPADVVEAILFFAGGGSRLDHRDDDADRRWRARRPQRAGRRRSASPRPHRRKARPVPARAGTGSSRVGPPAM